MDKLPKNLFLPDAVPEYVQQYRGFVRYPLPPSPVLFTSSEPIYANGLSAHFEESSPVPRDGVTRLHPSITSECDRPVALPASTAEPFLHSIQHCHAANLRSSATPLKLPPLHSHFNRSQSPMHLRQPYKQA